MYWGRNKFFLKRSDIFPIGIRLRFTEQPLEHGSQLLDILTAPQSLKPNTADPKSESAKAKYFDKKLRELKQGFKSVEPRIQGLPPGSIQKILDNLDSYIEAVDKVK